MSKKGLPFIGKLGDFIDRVLHPTVQKVGQSRAGLDVINRGYYLLNGGSTYTVEAGSDTNTVKLTTHAFKPGDLIRFATTSNTINEFEIIVDAITDANTFTLAGYLSASLTTGDTFYALRPISEQFSSTGASMTTLSASPIQYNRVTGGITTATNVTENLDTPSNSRALPVVIHGLDAAVVTVNANEINIRSDSTNDSQAIGNQAGTFYADVTAASALKVDGSAVTQPVSAASLPLPSGASTSANQTTINTSIGSLLTELQLKADLTETQPVSAASLPLPSGASTEATLSTLNGKVPANLTVTSTRLLVDGSGVTQPVSGTVTANLGTVAGLALDSNIDALRTLTGAVTEAAPASDTASSGLNGRLQRIAQRITSLIALVPASLGAQTGANSFSVVPASDAKFSIKPSTITTTYAENLTLTTVTTITAPANAVSVLVQADDTNANNIRIKQNATASVTSGFQLQAGRDIVFDGGQDLSVISDNNGSAGASVKIYFSWKVQA